MFGHDETLTTCRASPEFKMLLPFALAAALMAGSIQTMGPAEALRPPAPTAPEPVAAQTSPARGAVPAAGTAPAPERMICTSIPVTGSRFPIRRCRTPAQAEADRAESAEMLRRMQGARTPPAG